MRRVNFVGSLVIAGLAVGACSTGDRPPTPLAPSARAPVPQVTAQAATPCPTPVFILKEINTLYPAGGPMFLRAKALVLYAIEAALVNPPKHVKPDTAGATKIALALVDTTIKLFKAGKLGTGTDLATAQLTVAVLNGVLCTVGQPQVFTTDALLPGGAGAAQVVQPNAPIMTVATGDNNAGVQVPQGNLAQTTLVTIVPLNPPTPCAPFSGPLCTALAQFPPFFQFQFTPALPGNQQLPPFTFELCVDVSQISAPASAIFLAHNVTTGGVTAAQVLPKPPAGGIGLQCDQTQIGMRRTGSVLELARAGDFRGAVSQLGSDLTGLLYTDAFASGTGKSTSIGGTAHSASPFGLVDVNDIIPYQNGMWAYHAPSWLGSATGTAPPGPLTGDDPAFGSASYVPQAANGWVFNTSPFGDAPFGGGVGTNPLICPPQNLIPVTNPTLLVWPSFTPNTPPGNTGPSSAFLIQESFFLPTGWSTDLQIGIAIDNDVQVFFNGVDVTPLATPAQTLDGVFTDHEGCATQDSYVIPLSLSNPKITVNTGSTANVISVRARDRGTEDYLDVRVSPAPVSP